MAASAAPLRTSAKSDIGPARIEPDAAPIGQTAADSAGAVLNPSAAQPDRPDTAPQQGTALARSVGQQVTERVRTLAAESGGGTATLELRPPELGRLWLSVRVDGSSVAVRAVASSPVAGEMLQAGASALRESLGKAGMHFASLHVSVDSGAGGTFAGHAGQTAGHEQSTAHSAYRALTPAYGDLQSGSPDAARDDPGIRLAWRRAGGMSQMLDAVA
jgi:flagellar hook-length control protein FliK